MASILANEGAPGSEVEASSDDELVLEVRAPTASSGRLDAFMRFEVVVELGRQERTTPGEPHTLEEKHLVAVTVGAVGVVTPNGESFAKQLVLVRLPRHGGKGGAWSYTADGRVAGFEVGLKRGLGNLSCGKITW